MNQLFTIKDVLPSGMTVSDVKKALQKRVLKANQNKTALERGKIISELFPEEAKDTIRLGEEAMQGLLVLPGTGPELYFVGNPPKWTYNPANDNEYTFFLNRLVHLKTLAEAYGLTGDLKYAEKALSDLENWIDTNPCPPLTNENGEYVPGTFDGHRSPWRALEVGIRGYRTLPIVIELLADTPYFTDELLEKLLISVYEHCQILYHISPVLWPKANHNHYLMENLGLMSFACLFPEMNSSAQFLAHSQHELDRCMAAQCTPCGGQIEGSPSYHNGCTFWFSIRLIFARKFNIEVSETYTGQLKKMFLHSVYATRVCGGNFPWGDSHIADKEALPLAAFSCYMAYDDPSYLKTALYFYPMKALMEVVRDNLWRIADGEKLRHDLNEAALAPEKPNLKQVAWQKDLNQVYVHASWDKDALSFMTACRTPVENLHAHIDAGGFDMTAFGETLVTDPAIYTYKDDENRKHFKSALWHNCMTVNWQNMWEYIASWAYGPQKDGKIISVTEQDGMVSILSRHLNYEPVIATRVLAMIDKKFLLVMDRAENLSKNESVQVNFHLDRTCVKQTKHGLITCLADHANVELAYAQTVAPQFEVGKISTVNDVWHDSIIVHLNHTAEKAETFYHGTVILPHKAGEMVPSCRNYESYLTDTGFKLRFDLDDNSYEFLWDGTVLTRM